MTFKQATSLEQFLPLLPNNVTIQEDTNGVFLWFSVEKPSARLVFPIGLWLGVRRFNALYRHDPFWMRSEIGTEVHQVPVETQLLYIELDDGRFGVVVPLIHDHFRMSLEGDLQQGLTLVAESNDPATVTDKVRGLYIAFSSDLYALIPQAAEEVRRVLGTGRLRSEKPIPHFIDQFGWCTWDAFYADVSHEKVQEGLEAFKAGGVQPRLLILDMGWQTIRWMQTGESRLSAFEANEKFPGDLAPTVQSAKQNYDVRTFLVWHTINGHWGGVDGESFPTYGVCSLQRRFSTGIVQRQPTINDWWGGISGLVSPEHIHRFFHAYHRHLARQGVDGVKVDNQSTLEGLSHGLGGRVSLMQTYHEALEGSVHTHFKGNLINCMSCSNDMFYSALNSNVTRTSDDFYPQHQDSHGRHLLVNAMVSLWFGELTIPDWDMFQSGHPMGAFHAAGRAVSGGPVYVSDKPYEHDFDVLRKLVLHDGTILRCEFPGRPTRDSLFFDPVNEKALFKIFNRNRYSGVVGAFNVHYKEDGTPDVQGTVSPADVEGLEGERFVVYAHNGKTLHVMHRNEQQPLTLPANGFEIFTVVPIKEGIAPIGLTDMFNSGGAVVFMQALSSTMVRLHIRGTGTLTIWSERTPAEISDEQGNKLSYNYVDQVIKVEANSVIMLQLA
jgi:raffinose synthase